LDKALGFVFDEENLKMVAEWIHSEKITINGEVLDSELNPNQKYAIL
jgi:hypothetical protein